MGFGLVLVGMLAGLVSGAWIVVLTGSFLLALAAVSFIGTAAVLVAAFTLGAQHNEDEDPSFKSQDYAKA